MIILKKETLKLDETSISIVDGQQRITTLLLILKVLETKFQKIEQDSSIVKEIQNTYSIIDEKNEYSKRLKILGVRDQNDLDKIFFDNYDVKELKNQFKDKKYINNFEVIMKFLNSNFRDSNSITEFYKKMKKINFSIVILGDEINENKIFEDLNSKGSLLKIDDLLRNYFSMLFKEKAFLKRENLTFEVDNFEKLINNIEKFIREEKKREEIFFQNK